MSYKIIDEPSPSKAETFTVNPIWPLFGFMFGSPILSWIWSVVNAHFMGSSTVKREALVAAAGIFLSTLYVSGMMYVFTYKILPENSIEYLKLGLILIQLAISYVLFHYQDSTFELYQYFGGVVKSGLPVVIVLFLLGKRVDTFIYENFNLLKFL